MEAIRKALHAELRPIMAGDGDAVARLEGKLAEAHQTHMRDVNAPFSATKAGKEARVAAIRQVVPEIDPARAALMLQPRFANRHISHLNA